MDREKYRIFLSGWHNISILNLRVQWVTVKLGMKKEEREDTVGDA